MISTCPPHGIRGIRDIIDTIPDLDDLLESDRGIYDTNTSVLFDKDHFGRLTPAEHRAVPSNATPCQSQQGRVSTVILCDQMVSRKVRYQPIQSLQPYLDYRDVIC